MNLTSREIDTIEVVEINEVIRSFEQLEANTKCLKGGSEMIAKKKNVRKFEDIKLDLKRYEGLRSKAFPPLFVDDTDFEKIWKEIAWSTKKVIAVHDVFCNITGNSVGSGYMAYYQLMEFLKQEALSCYSKCGGYLSLQRNDLCFLFSGMPFIDYKIFLRIMGLMDVNTAHNTSSLVGIMRLKLIFSYYDFGLKGFWDLEDWLRFRTDLLFPYQLNNDNNDNEKICDAPYSLYQAIELLNSFKEDDAIFTQFDNITFNLFIRLVERRIIKGTSKMFRVNFPDCVSSSNYTFLNVDNTDCNIFPHLDTRSVVSCKTITCQSICEINSENVENKKISDSKLNDTNVSFFKSAILKYPDTVSDSASCNSISLVKSSHSGLDMDSYSVEDEKLQLIFGPPPVQHLHRIFLSENKLQKNSEICVSCPKFAEEAPCLTSS